MSVTEFSLVCNYLPVSITDKSPFSWLKKLIQCNLSLRTPLYYGQFVWPQRCQKSYIPYLYNTDTSVKRTLGSVPLVSVLKRFDCIGCRSNSTKTDHFNAFLTASRRPMYKPFTHLGNNKKFKVCLKVPFSNGACSLICICFLANFIISFLSPWKVAWHIAHIFAKYVCYWPNERSWWLGSGYWPRSFFAFS